MLCGYLWNGQSFWMYVGPFPLYSFHWNGWCQCLGRILLGSIKQTLTIRSVKATENKVKMLIQIRSLVYLTRQPWKCMQGLFFTPDEKLYNKRINEVFDDEVLIPISGFIGEPCLLLKIGILLWRWNFISSALSIISVVCLDFTALVLYPLQPIRIYDFANGQVSGIFWCCFPLQYQGG